MQLCVVNVTHTRIKHKYQECINAGNKFCTVPLKIYGPLVWKLLRVTRGRLEAVPRILKTLLTPDMYT
jgi:hypothetical protein